MPHSRHKRREGSDYRHKARQDNGFSAVTFIEAMGFIQIATTENLRVRITKQLLAEQSANGVVDRIADDGRDDHQQYHQVNIEIVRRQRRERARDEQQGIARQEWRHHQPGFAEQNQKQNGINPDAVLGNQFGKVHINMQDEIN